VILQIFDHHWRAHLSAIDHLRQGVGLMAYAQKDPKTVFKKESFTLFEELLNTIKFEITRVLMLVQVKSEEDAGVVEKKNNKPIKSSKSNEPNISKIPEPKVGRNDICPCGSQKKYKHCHGALK
jgi:preprotein translocase subunit SecA